MTKLFWLWFVIFAALIVVLLMILYFLKSQDYEKFKFEITQKGVCEYYYEKCRCFGSLIEEQSYPPKYNCTGYERCKTTNYTKGEGC